MKRKQWEVPKIEFQEFSPNAFCSGCTNPTNMVKYDFVCNAGKKLTYTYTGADGMTYTTDNHIYHMKTSDGTYLTWVKSWKPGGYYLFGKCGVTHPVVVPKGTNPTTIFLPGYIDDAFTQQNENIPVFIWRGENGDDIHATESLVSSGIDIPKNVS